MTHASVPADQRAALGISDGLIRLSCGVEETADLLSDVERSFK
jgi:cystathionine beta-lyase/cystathionine gamma-synthase